MKNTYLALALLAVLTAAPSEPLAQSTAKDDFKLALAARQIGDHETTYAYAAKAVKKEPWIAAHHSVAIYAAVQLGRFSGEQCGNATISQIDSVDPELKEVFKACGFAYRAQGDTAAAIEHYEYAMSKNPTDTDTLLALDGLKKAKAEGDIKSKSRQIRLILADLKNNPVLTDTQANWVRSVGVSVEDKILVLSVAGRHSEAVALLGETSYKSLKPYGIHALAKSYRALQEMNKAQSVYEYLMQKDDVEFEVIPELFYIYTDTHQYEAAQKFLRNVESRFEGNRRVKEAVVRLQAKILAWSGNADRAVKLTTANFNAETAAMVVPQLQAGERPRQAIAGYENQLVQSPSNTYAKLDKARAHIQLRELAQAEIEIHDVKSQKGIGVSPALIEKSEKALETARKPGIGTSMRIQKEQGEKGSKVVSSNTYAYLSSDSGRVEGTIDVGTVLEEIPDARASRYETLSFSGNAKFRYGEVLVGLSTDSERSTISPSVGASLENDYVKASLSIKTNNQLTGARARAANVSSDLVSASLSLRPTSRLSVSAVGSLERLSDSNQRERVSLSSSYALMSAVDKRVSAYAASAVTSNSSNAVVYYAPVRLKSNLFGLKASKDVNFVEKRITLGLDAYVGKQDEIRFGDAVIGGATVSVDFNIDTGFGLSVYAGADQRVYDGKGVVDFKGGLNVSGRF